MKVFENPAILIKIINLINLFMKILPILIIPLFFLIVYLGVENLTQNNLQNDSNRFKINSLEPKKIEENSETISDKEKLLVKSKDSELKFEEKK